jgi:hypothetical protein
MLIQSILIKVKIKRTYLHFSKTRKTRVIGMQRFVLRVFNASAKGLRRKF